MPVPSQLEAPARIAVPGTASFPAVFILQCGIILCKCEAANSQAIPAKWLRIQQKKGPRRPLPSSQPERVQALAAATASLDDADHVPNGQRLNSDTKAFVISELERMGHKTIPSQANFIMFDCRKPVVPLIKTLKERSVHVGRLFPALPNHMRLTIGKKSEMERFLAAFREVAA